MIVLIGRIKLNVKEIMMLFMLLYFLAIIFCSIRLEFALASFTLNIINKNKPELPSDNIGAKNPDENNI